MINATIAGNIGSDVEIKTIGNGPALKMRVAVSTYDKATGKGTTWIGVTVFGARAESLGKILRKGEKVCVAGALKQRSYQAKDGTTKTELELVASEVTPMGGGAPRDGAPTGAGGGGRSGPDDGAADNDFPF